MNDVNNEIDQYIESCFEFKNYSSLKEYIDDIFICLIHSSWQYTKEDAKIIIKNSMKFIKHCYNVKESAYGCAMDIGYFCG